MMSPWNTVDFCFREVRIRTSFCLLEALRGGSKLIPSPKRNFQRLLTSSSNKSIIKGNLLFCAILVPAPFTILEVVSLVKPLAGHLAHSLQNLPLFSRLILTKMNWIIFS